MHTKYVGRSKRIYIENFENLESYKITLSGQTLRSIDEFVSASKLFHPRFLSELTDS